MEHIRNIKNFNLRSVVPDGLWNWSTRVLLPVMLREIVEIRSPRMAPGERTGEIALESAIPDAFWSVSFQPDTSQDPSHTSLALNSAPLHFRPPHPRPLPDLRERRRVAAVLLAVHLRPFVLRNLRLQTQHQPSSRLINCSGLS